MQSGEGQGTLKPRYNNPFNNKIAAIKNLILSPSGVNCIVKSPCINKILVMKNKIFGPLRFVKPRLLCTVKSGDTRTAKDVQSSESDWQSHVIYKCSYMILSISSIEYTVLSKQTTLETLDPRYSAMYFNVVHQSQVRILK
jgi:hypothetical protein